MLTSSSLSRGKRSEPLLDIYSAGRAGTLRRDRLTATEIEHIRRTVRRVPEVMVKVTGGGRTVIGVDAHMAYISHEGEAPMEDDRGEPVPEGELKALVKDWHLELSTGLYRHSKHPDSRKPALKLVHNVVLSMPRPTPPAAVHAAARHFAREHFGSQHRYAMALHTHQHHPHVHLVIKAEREDGEGRLRIDKALLRQWREDFAQAMRAQGIAANATPRAWRGQSKRPPRDAAYWTEKRGTSHVLQNKVKDIARELQRTRTYRDPARAKLLESRKTIIAGWESMARTLDNQGEIELAGDVRYFAGHLPQVLTDRERLAIQFIDFIKHGRKPSREERVPERRIERTR